VRTVSICVRERPRTFSNLANHSSPITERSRSFANKTAELTAKVTVRRWLFAVGRWLCVRIYYIYICAANYARISDTIRIYLCTKCRCARHILFRLFQALHSYVPLSNSHNSVDHIPCYKCVQGTTSTLFACHYKN